MSQNYTVASVGQPRSWSTKQGMPFISYDIVFVDELVTVELVQKPETPAPTPGQQLFGDIHPDQHRQGAYRFKKAPQGQQQSFNGGAPRGESDDQRQHSIVRQHSQEMALRYYAIAGVAPPREKLSELIDWFQHDAEKAPVSNTPAPQRPSVPESDVPADFTGLEPSTASGATGDSDPF